MGEENNGGVDTDAKEQNEQFGDLSNRDVKNHSLFKKITSQLGEATKELESFRAKEAERERKSAERKADYETATKITVEKAIKEAREKWEAEQSILSKRAEAKLQLVKAGFKNEALIKGLLADFDHDSMTAEDFAKAAAESEENKPFLASSSSYSGRPNPDTQSLNSSKIKTLTDAEIEQLRKTGNPEDKAKAHKALLDGWTG